MDISAMYKTIQLEMIFPLGPEKKQKYLSSLYSYCLESFSLCTLYCYLGLFLAWQPQCQLLELCIKEE